MIAFSVKIRDIGLKRKAALALKAFSDLTPEMTKIGKWVVDDARRRLKARRSAISNGRLARSLQSRPFKRSVIIGSVLPYAGIQQRGGVVRPRKRKMLAIPLQPDLAKSHTWPKHIDPARIERVGNVLYLLRKKKKARGKLKTRTGKRLDKLAKKIRKGSKTARRQYNKLARSAGKTKVVKNVKKRLGLSKRKPAARAKGKTQRVEFERVPGWLLVKQARIPGRPYVVKSRALITYMREVFARKLKDLNRRAG